MQKPEVELTMTGVRAADDWRAGALQSAASELRRTLAQATVDDEAVEIRRLASPCCEFAEFSSENLLKNEPLSRRTA